MSKYLFITTYPIPFGVNGGVATTTKRLLQEWSIAAPKDDIIVLADYYGEEVAEMESTYRLKRVFQPGSWRSLARLWRHILQYGRRKLIWEQELAIYGSPAHTGFILLQVLALRSILRWDTIIVCHQVVTDIGDLAKHIGISSETLIGKLYNKILLPTFYRVCGLAAKQIVVYEPILADRLNKLGIQNVRVIPLGVDNPHKGNGIKAMRHRLGVSEDDFVVTLFGFIAWYKGHHLLLKTAKLLPNVKFIIAGGESPSQRDNPTYKSYYRSILNQASKLPNVTVTGFVAENDVGKLLRTSDLIVFPYQTLMSSSGPLAQTIAYERPFMLSSSLRPVISNQQNLENVPVIFRNSRDLAASILELQASPKKLDQLKKLSLSLKASRQWSLLIQAYRSI